MNIFSYFQKIGIDTVDESFYRKIKEWTSWYNANVRKFTFYKVYTGRGTYKRCQRKTLGMAKKVCEDMHRENVELRTFIEQGLDQRLKKEQEVLYDTYNDLASFISKDWKIAVRNFFRNIFRMSWIRPDSW